MATATRWRLNHPSKRSRNVNRPQKAGPQIIATARTRAALLGMPLTDVALSKAISSPEPTAAAAMNARPNNLDGRKASISNLLARPDAGIGILATRIGLRKVRKKPTHKNPPAVSKVRTVSTSSGVIASILAAKIACWGRKHSRLRTRMDQLEQIVARAAGGAPWPS